MERLTSTQIDQLLANGCANAFDGHREEFRPVVKLFCPWTGATWLLSELDPDDPDLAFGLCDLGFGFPELGSVRLSELRNVIGPGGLTIERDIHFVATMTLTEYADEARRVGAIVA
jgi:hypothetical protein